MLFGFQLPENHHCCLSMERILNCPISGIFNCIFPLNFGIHFYMWNDWAPLSFLLQLRQGCGSGYHHVPITHTPGALCVKGSQLPENNLEFFIGFMTSKATKGDNGKENGTWAPQRGPKPGNCILLASWQLCSLSLTGCVKLSQTQAKERAFNYTAITPCFALLTNLDFNSFFLLRKCFLSLKLTPQNPRAASVWVPCLE